MIDKGKKKRIKCIVLLFALCIVVILSGGARGFAEEIENKMWAFYNDGSLVYEDNEFSWYSDLETVHGVAGIDIGLMPVREEDYSYHREVVVAVIDTGIDTDHPALQKGLWNNPGEVPDDGVDNDGNGYIDDVFGWNFYKNSNVMYNTRNSTEDAHGTHCAGIIAANATAAGIVGIAGGIPQIKVMSVKTLGGINQTGTTEKLIQGIQYAQENGASICNLSVGLKTWNEELYQTMKNSDMLFVVAAGNGESEDYGTGFDLELSKRYPACFPLDNMLVVSNLKCDGTLHYSSCYGKDYVDLAAPGTWIYSTSTHKSGYENMTGTSMAAPMVSGAAALLYASHEEWDLEKVRESILSSCTVLESLKDKVKTEGMLNVSRAMKYDDNEENGNPTATPEENGEQENSQESPKPQETTNPEPTVSSPEPQAMTGGQQEEENDKKEKTITIPKVSLRKIKVRKKSFYCQIKKKKSVDGVQLVLVRKTGKKQKKTKRDISFTGRGWYRLCWKNSKGKIIRMKARYYKMIEGRKVYGQRKTIRITPK